MLNSKAAFFKMRSSKKLTFLVPTSVVLISKGHASTTLISLR